MTFNKSRIYFYQIRFIGASGKSTKDIFLPRNWQYYCIYLSDLSGLKVDVLKAHNQKTRKTYTSQRVFSFRSDLFDLKIFQ